MLHLCRLMLNMDSIHWEWETLNMIFSKTLLYNTIRWCLARNSRNFTQLYIHSFFPRNPTHSGLLDNSDCTTKAPTFYRLCRFAIITTALGAVDSLPNMPRTNTQIEWENQRFKDVLRRRLLRCWRAGNVCPHQNHHINTLKPHITAHSTMGLSSTLSRQQMRTRKTPEAHRTAFSRT